MRSLLKQLIPPLLLNWYKRLRHSQTAMPDPKISGANEWKGNYTSWQGAVNDTTGYDDNEILVKCRNALLKVKNGEAKYERDSVLFDEIEYSWPLLTALLRAALENNNSLSVLDFGGSFGSTYFQNKDFLSSLAFFRWHIVEQKQFVEEGKKNFEDDTLKFFYTLEESIKSRKPDILILSSVLQYLPQPYETLDKILSMNIPYIVIDRTAFINQDNDLLTVQTVGEEIYKASYPAWFFGVENFKKKFKHYDVLASFNSHEGYVITLENELTATYKGFILKHKYDN